LETDDRLLLKDELLNISAFSCFSEAEVDGDLASGKNILSDKVVRLLICGDLLSTFPRPSERAGKRVGIFVPAFDAEGGDFDATAFDDNGVSESEELYSGR